MDIDEIKQELNPIETDEERKVEDDTFLDPDSDLNIDTGKASIDLEDVLLVFFGGCLGGVIRAAAFSAMDKTMALFLVNLLGAFLLGYTLEAVVLRDKNATSQKRLRLFFGTGCMGAFTTYSTFIGQISTMILAASYLNALYLATIIILLGFIFALLGIYTARLTMHERSHNA